MRSTKIYKFIILLIVLSSVSSALLNADSPFQRMQQVADKIKKDVEDHLGRTFETFKVMEHKDLEDSEETSYFMKILVDDNGHVRVKTVQKEPKGDWKVHVEEYDKGNAAIEQGEKREDTAIGKDDKGEDTITRQDDNDKAQKSSPSSLSADSLFERMQKIADSVKKDVENRLDTTFKIYKVMEHKELQDPELTSYSMKILVDDNGHVRVKTIQKEPKGDWKVHVEEYDKGNAAIGEGDKEENAEISQGDKSNGKVSSHSSFSPDSILERMQRIADTIKKDVESHLQRTFETFKVMEHKDLEIPDEASYFMKILVDDNGHVRVKTVQKEPKGEWKVHVEEYDKGKAAIGESDKNENTVISQESKDDSFLKKIRRTAGNMKRGLENFFNRIFKRKQANNEQDDQKEDAL